MNKKRMMLSCIAAMLLLYNGCSAPLVQAAAETEEAQAEKASTSVSATIFQPYVYAIERASIWKDYRQSLAQASEKLSTLAQFGLDATDEAAQVAEQLTAADEQLAAAQLAEATQFQAVTQTGTSTADEAASQPPAAESEMDALQEELAAAYQSVQQAWEQEDAARRAAQAAKLQQQSGLLTLSEQLVAEDSYRQASLLAVDQAQAYTTLLLGSGEASSLRAMLNKLQEQPDMLVPWIAALKAYASASYAGQPSQPAAYGPVHGRPVQTLPLSSIALINGELNNAMRPFLTRDGEVFVPIRAWAEALQYDVVWMPDAAYVELELNGHHYQITQNSKQIAADGQPIEMTDAAILYKGRMFVPLSLFSKGLNQNVYWNSQYQQGYIVASQSDEQSSKGESIIP